MSAEHSHGQVAHHFDTLEQQHSAATLGMWAFLATEILFFGVILASYSLYRIRYTEAFARASEDQNVLLGTINTAILLGSSLTMALAVHRANGGSRRAQVQFLGATILLGSVFLGVKAYEYAHHYHQGLAPGVYFVDAPWIEQKINPRHVELYYCFYYVMTGLHALHMVIGIGVLFWLMWLAHCGRFSRDYSTPVEMTGLYWHFVDIVWIFLFPLLYLIHQHSGH